MEMPPQMEFKDSQFSETKEIHAEERKLKLACHSTNIQESIFQDLYRRISDLNKIERVLAHCLRFISNCKFKGKGRTKPLTMVDIETARLHLIRNAQAEAFHEELVALRQAKNLKASSKILALHPIIDEKDLLRVGGRLCHAPWSFAKIHPILLPANHLLTRLLIEREHKRLLHSGPQALLVAIR